MENEQQRQQRTTTTTIYDRSQQLSTMIPEVNYLKHNKLRKRKRRIVPEVKTLTGMCYRHSYKTVNVTSRDKVSRECNMSVKNNVAPSHCCLLLTTYYKNTEIFVAPL